MNRVLLSDVRHAYDETGWQPVVGTFYELADEFREEGVSIPCGCAVGVLYARLAGVEDYPWEFLPCVSRWWEIVSPVLGVSPAYLAGYVAGFDGDAGGVNREAVDASKPSTAKEDLFAGLEDGRAAAAALFPAIVEYGGLFERGEGR